MIDQVRGPVLAVSPQRVTIGVAGVGLGVAVSDESGFVPKQEVTLHTHFHWTQEQGPSIFGFLRLFEKQAFQLLIGCPGVGPKMALSLLGQLRAEDLLQALVAGDTRGLSALNGIGPKKAEQLIVQLRSKAEELLARGAGEGVDAHVVQWQQVSQVLASLNYSRPEISQALQFVREKHGGTQSFDALVRHALAFLAKRP